MDKEVPSPQRSSSVGQAAPHEHLVLRDGSFTVRAGRLYNSLPRYLRDYSGDKATMNGFKSQLDKFLELVPDRPRETSGGWLPAAIDQATG